MLLIKAVTGAATGLAGLALVLAQAAPTTAPPWLELGAPAIAVATLAEVVRRFVTGSIVAKPVADALELAEDLREELRLVRRYRESRGGPP